MKNKLTIRFANAQDIDLILYFIKSLAVYEEMLDEVIATKTILHDALFVQKAAEVLLVYEDDKPVGFALFFQTFSTFLGTTNLYLEDLFIDPNYRGKGYGKAVFKYLVNLALKRNCKRLEWVCLNWNQSAIDFYKRLGATSLDAWTTYRLDHQAMQKLSK